MTFMEPALWQNCRILAARLLGVPAGEILITPNASFGIQLVMQSFLRQAEDEVLTSNLEHGSVNTIAKYLEQSRRIKSRQVSCDPFDGSEEFCRKMISALTEKTKLVVLSQINCFNGWRPDLSMLKAELDRAKIPFLLDGAHALGQGLCAIENIGLWVGSAHKWMGAPNGCGFLRLDKNYHGEILPLTLGDRYFREDLDLSCRLEWPGTCDTTRLLGLAAALELQLKLGPEKIAARQFRLRRYLTDAFKDLCADGPFSSAQILTPEQQNEGSAIFAARFQAETLNVQDLRESLWQDEKIWIQPEFSAENPGLGMRISCNVFNSEQEIDLLISALHKRKRYR